MTFALTFSRQVKKPFVCLFAIKHLQRVFSFIALCWVKDFNPNLLHAAARLCSGSLVNPLLSKHGEEHAHSYVLLYIKVTI